MGITRYRLKKKDAMDIGPKDAAAGHQSIHLTFETKNKRPPLKRQSFANMSCLYILPLSIVATTVVRVMSMLVTAQQPAQSTAQATTAVLGAWCR